MEMENKPDFSRENLVYYKMEFNSFCISATHDRECIHERENFSQEYEFKYKEQANVGT